MDDEGVSAAAAYPALKSGPPAAGVNTNLVLGLLMCMLSIVPVTLVHTHSGHCSLQGANASAAPSSKPPIFQSSDTDSLQYRLALSHVFIASALKQPSLAGPASALPAVGSHLASPASLGPARSVFLLIDTCSPTTRLFVLRPSGRNASSLPRFRYGIPNGPAKCGCFRLVLCLLHVSQLVRQLIGTYFQLVIATYPLRFRSVPNHFVPP